MTDSIYPILENAALVDRRQVDAYLEVLFGYVDWSDRVFALRGLGEKGTEKEGVFREPLRLPAGLCSIEEQTETAARRWGQYHVATFVVPAVVSADAIELRNVDHEQIAEFTTILVDIDSGDTDEKLVWLAEIIGRPTLVVQSGGVTDAGKPKRHVYWRLTEPSTEIDRIAALRETLALKVGGDPSFKRATQVIRVPGTVHGKNGVITLCRIEALHDIGDYDLDDLAERIEQAQPMPGLPPVPAKTAVLDFSPTQGGAMDFSAAAGGNRPNAVKALTSDVHEGGTGRETRWDNFNQVAGYHLRLVRWGTIPLDQAAQATYDWMQAHMVPPWSEQRFKAEFQGQIDNDRRNNGALPDTTTPPPEPYAGALKFDMKLGALRGFDIGNWAMGTPPKRRHLVQGLIMAGQTHVLAAEGGAGKTFLCLDLCLRLAAAGNRTDPAADNQVLWMGQPVTDEAAGGTVIMITSEDAHDELHIRLDDIDPDGSMRAAATGHLRIIPLLDVGGAFPFVAHDQARQPHQSPRWAALYAAIAEIVGEGGKVSAVVVDTMAATLHGEDTSGSVVTEYMAELSRLCGALGAAVVITHHIRKGNDQTPIKNLEDMKAAVRGSTAIIGSTRVALGFWHASDFRRKMEAMGHAPSRGKVYYAGVLKANNPEMFDGVKTLMRQLSGLLVDVTDRVPAADKIRTERLAWLVVAVQRAAFDHYPLTKTNANGLFQRRSQLPPALQQLPRAEYERLVDMALEAGLIVRGALANKPANTGHLDVPGGPIDRKQGFQDDGVWKPEWTRFEYDPTIEMVVMADE
ncbi:AAA family ATPase [Thalassobaculum sp. OXR-137]|uniref:AAA family ATPase n=1 Tax=Thalassobaculum sp. OXR-137 TaxID=3100173 RepID=UPI002AC8DA49|nr:AAA family ATPase [Thalassobaculum sp. OXR-137]WPZ36735.1 AAA family ATPase [Thalassobaculum sp. OXR-137]